jgi:hypothetical protein
MNQQHQKTNNSKKNVVKKGGNSNNNNNSNNKKPLNSFHSAELYAWGSYQTTPEPNEIPKPSKDMIQKALTCEDDEDDCKLWLPKTVPTIQQHQQQQQTTSSETDTLSNNLMRMLGVGM